MWRTIKFKKNGEPLVDVNEQGVFYSYQTKNIKALKQLKRKTHQYLYWTDNNHNYFVHREVAKAFPEICGEWFEGCQVHHRDGDPLNNEAKNLIVCTKEQHKEYHRIMRVEKKKKIKQLKVDDPNFIDNKLKEFLKRGKYSVHFYCRKCKQNKNGLSPIEINIYQKGERYMRNTGIFADPYEFEKGIYPKEFIDFRNKEFRE